MQEQTAGLPMQRGFIRDTLAEGATRIAEDASIRRADLLMQRSFDVLALAMHAAEGIGAGNSLEKMLAHQMALAHDAALRMTDRALRNEHGHAGDQVEACRCIDAATRLVSLPAAVTPPEGSSISSLD